MKVEIKTIREYSVVLGSHLKKQEITKKERDVILKAYLHIFKHGMDFANGKLVIETK